MPSAYDYNAASRVTNFNTGPLSIPGGGQWSQFISSLAGRLTQGKASPNDMKIIAAAQAQRGGPDGRGGGTAQTATQFIEGLMQNLRNINAPENQIQSLAQQLNRLAQRYFPAQAAPAHGRMAPRQIAQAHQHPAQAPRGLSGPPMPISRVTSPGPVGRMAVPMAVQASPLNVRVQVTGQPLPGVVPAPMPVARVVGVAPVGVVPVGVVPVGMAPPRRQWAPAPMAPMAQQAPAGQGYNPAAVIHQGLADMRLKAFQLAERIKSGDQSAIGYLAGQRVNAQNGDWNARQFLTYAQTALQQIGHDPSYARWSGEGSFPHSGHDHGYGASNSSNMEVDLTGCHTEDYIDALSLIARAKYGDQNSIATLQLLHRGGPRSQRILRCVKDIQGRDPSFGASRRPSNAARSPASPPVPARHPAVTALRKSTKKSAPKASAAKRTASKPAQAAGMTNAAAAGIISLAKSATAGGSGLGSPLAGIARQAGQTVNSPSTTAAQAAAQASPSGTPSAAAAAPMVTSQLPAQSSGSGYSSMPGQSYGAGGGGGGGDSSGGGGGSSSDDSSGGDDGSSSDDSSGDSSGDSSFSYEPAVGSSRLRLGDRGLHPHTGMPVNPYADNLVRRARAGDKSAKQEIGDVMRLSRTGDPRGTALAAALLARTAGNPDIAGEIANGHAANLSHSHPLTQKRVENIGRQVAAQHGPAAVSEYLAHVQSPHGAISSSLPAWTGQVVGRAQAMQAARFPNGRIRFVSPRAARELGEA